MNEYVANILSTKQTIEEKVASSQLKLLADSQPITAKEEYGRLFFSRRYLMIIHSREKTERRKVRFETDEDDDDDDEEEDEEEELNDEVSMKLIKMREFMFISISGI